MTIEKIYVCGICDCEYDNQDEARLCCAGGLDAVYICDECGQHCDYEDEAILCCADEVEPSYKCTCDNIFDSEEEAVNCYLHHS